MPSDVFDRRDQEQIQAHGLSLSQVLDQVRRFRSPPVYARLLRPCVAGDGIRVLAPKEADALAATWERAMGTLRCLKFVPASGAASRMFKSLLKVRHEAPSVTRDTLLTLEGRGDRDAGEALRCLDGLGRLALYGPLEQAASGKGFSLARLLQDGAYGTILELLLGDECLGYAALPKGLLPFHATPEGPVTPFEEHLLEAASYARGTGGFARVHFTVSEEHLGHFRKLALERGPSLEKSLGVRFEISFSTQSLSTDTLAVDLQNAPFRDSRGRLVFRPGGHGALLQNLADQDADILFLKNIDNVVVARLRPETAAWKKTLAGYLLDLQERIFGILEGLDGGGLTPPEIEEAMAFAAERLCLRPPPGTTESPEARKAFLADRLNRPLRVCGMVRNVGEPGGGPFWVHEPDGGASLQIVETAQVDPDSPAQQGILQGSTHFNPVDLVCGVRDRRGEAFDLRRHVDRDAVFISLKSKDGRDLKALEHPGLWNGSMARWITAFVEVPSITFNPVKTVNDLLRDAHQA